MLPKSLIRVTVAKQYPQLDRYALTSIVDKIHKWAYSEQDLSPAAIRGQVQATLTHERTNYEEQLRAHGSTYYAPGRKDFRDAARQTLKLKYGV